MIFKRTAIQRGGALLLALLLSATPMVACRNGDQTDILDESASASDSATETAPSTETETDTAPVTGGETDTEADTNPVTDGEDDTETDPAETESDGALLSPTALKVNLLEAALGIPTEAPAFSWAMQSEETNIHQSAYRIVFASTAANMTAETYLHDTGWVESNQNAAVTVGYTFSENSLYYWRVQVKDQHGRISPWSEASAIVTEVGDAWVSTTGIWAPEGVVESFADHGWTDYTVEMDISITSTAAGVIFRAVDSQNFLMWQFRTDAIHLHEWKNGSVVGGKQFATVSLADTGLDLTAGTPFRIRIVAEGATVSTYIDDTATGEHFVLADTREVNANLSTGAIGFRTGNSESFTVDNIHVYTSEETLYQDDFSTADAVNYFEKTTLSGGVLSVPKAASAGILMDGYYGSAEKRNYVFLRQAFSLTDEQIDRLERATVSVSAKSPESTRQYVYNLYLNGEFVGLGPARYGNKTIYYNTYDVTDMLAAGTNVIGAINYTTAEKSFLLQMTVFYKDGTSEVLLNSGRDRTDWRALDGTAAFGDNGTSIGTNYYFAAAENLNATVYPFGWTEADYDASAWQEPASCGAFVASYALLPYPADNVGREYIPVASVQQIRGDNYLIDFGREVVGGLQLTIDVPASVTLTIRSGEELAANRRSVQYKMNTGNVYEEFWTLKAGSQTLENIGMKTVRYVEIIGSPVEITADMVRAVAIKQAFSSDESSFESSDEVLNRIYDTMKYAIEATNGDLYTDSQSRERAAYEGDAFINMLSSYSFEDDYSLARFSCEWLYDHPTWPAEYKLLSVSSAWLDYLYTGDARSIETYYTVLQGKLFENCFDETYGLLKRPNNNGGGANALLVDWPASDRDGYAYSEAVYNTVFNAVAYGAYCDMAKIADALGKTEDAAHYNAIAATIKTSMMEKLYIPEQGAFSDGLTATGARIDHTSQHATAYALASGVYDSQTMADDMANFLRSQGEIRMSIYGAYFLLEGLYNAGAGDLALSLMANPDTTEGTRSYAYLIDKLGMTICAEAWNETLKSNMTYSHAWGTAPASQIVRGLFGIRPTSAAFATFDIRLQPGALDYASVQVPTVKGEIAVEFDTRAADTLLDVSVHIPANTTATVTLPTMGATAVTLLVDGVEVDATVANGTVSLELGSGTHTLTVSA